MPDKTFSTVPPLSSLFVAVLASAFIACAGEVGDDEQDAEEQEDAPHHVHSSALTQPQWVFCANQGKLCSFIGTKQVRFGANQNTVIRTLTSGAACTNQTFGVSFGEGNSCSVLLNVEVTMGPYINKWRIPPGNPGVSVVEIAATSEQPQPSEIGAFRTSCSYSHMNFDDPIVFPGQPGKAHLHAYFGNKGAKAASTAESLRNSGNSTCRGGIANRSAYWVPALIDKDGVPLKPQSAQIYYKTGHEGIRPDQVQVFPQGLRMIAGDAKAAGPVQERAYWSCDTFNGHPNAIPDCAPGEPVIMIVAFPQCWNGTSLDSADHKSHMSYPVNGSCPRTHPIAIPAISFNIFYDVPAGKRSSEWRLASDMYSSSLPGGYSAHGDWFEGWDPQVARAFVTNCNRASRDCHSHLLGDGRMIFNSLERD